MRAILAAGGTAGHINPALAIAREIVSNGGEVLFIGNEGKMEQELVPKEGFNIKCIKVSGLKRSLSPKNIVALWQAAGGVLKTRSIIKEFNPDIVIGCGGYVSGPAVLAAAKLKIPTLIHEQNAFAGMTTKILCRYADTVCISFEESRKYLSAKNIVLTGNPVRENILELSSDEARARLGLTRKLVLVFGGSLGAKKINDTMEQFVFETDGSFDVVWGTGNRCYDEIMQRIGGKEIPENIKIMPYIYNMDEIMSAADVVVSRAGAITLGEICAKGKCAVLIPSPYVANNHQEYNARAMEKNGAAELICEGDLNAKTLKEKLDSILKNPEKMQKMQANALEMGMPQASKTIYEELKKLVKG